MAANARLRAASCWAASLLAALLMTAAWSVVSSQTTRPQPTTKPAAATAPAGKNKPDNLGFWLTRAKEGAKAESPLEKGTDPFRGTKSTFQREDALPGVIEMSDGRLLAGGLYTTREKPWEVYAEKEKRWRQIPFINVLSITAVILEEKMEQRWRWKEMGVPERVYTGKEYPFRLFEWKLHLIDGTYMQGTVKGQPLWVEMKDSKAGPFILHERFSGPDGAKFKDCPYAKRVFVSRRLMDEVVKEQESQPPKKEK